MRCQRTIHCPDRTHKIFVALFFLACLLIASPVRAHRVIIFGWVEGDLIHTESKFSGGKKVKNGTVVAYSTDGNAFSKAIRTIRVNSLSKYPKRSTSESNL